jgi:hypothetical protein
MHHRAATQGSCLCGAVRYEVDGPFSTMLHCHCSMCRKHHGAAFATFVGAPLMGFRWLAGRHHVEEYASSTHGRRNFCRHCGSVAPTLVESMDLAFMPAGNLGDIDMRPQFHSFVGSKARWYEIRDRLPQHEEYPPEFGMGGVSRPEIETRAGVVAGSCLCGEVAYEIAGPAMVMRHCHCSRCRRARSAAHATNAIYPLESFKFTRGEDRVVTFRVPEARFFAVGFCRRCGGGTPHLSRERGFAVVPAGTLDNDPGVRPAHHIFVGSKANWFDIADDLPRYDTQAPG